MIGTPRGLDNFNNMSKRFTLWNTKGTVSAGCIHDLIFSGGFRNVKNRISCFVRICVELDVKHTGNASRISQDHKPPAEDSLIPKTQWLSGWVLWNDIKHVGLWTLEFILPHLSKIHQEADLFLQHEVPMLLSRGVGHNQMLWEYLFKIGYCNLP